MANLKRGLTIALCVVMLFALASCSMVTVNEERDNAQIVAEVNGSTITKDKYKAQLENMLYTYGMTEDQLKQEGDPNLYKEEVLDQLVEQELMYQAAEKEGLVDNTEEHRAELKEEQEQNLAEMKEYFLSMAEESEEPNAKEDAKRQYEEYIQDAGLDNVENYINDTIKAEAASAMYDKVIEGIEFTEEQAKEYYDEQVEIQQPMVEEDPKNFSLYQMGEQAYVNPEGSKYVMNLLLALPEEAQSEISALREAGDDKEADALRDEELAKIKSEAEDALKRAKAGEDFDALVEELGEDPGMEQEPAKTHGYLAYDGAQFVEEFLEASLALGKEGDISELVPTDFGYHIIKYQKDGAGPVDFEILKDDIVQKQLQSKQSSAYYKFMEEQKEDAKITIYLRRV